jgi:CheY-like chemotaxis protein
VSHRCVAASARDGVEHCPGRLPHLDRDQRALPHPLDVANAVEALARLRNERFDAVVTDIVLPGMDGWQLIAAAIHEQPCCGSSR